MFYGYLCLTEIFSFLTLEMASSRKIITLCLCLMLVSFGVVVEAGQGMMGLFGGGGGKHGGGNEMLETLLAAGILAMLLKNIGHGYSHGRSSGGHGYGVGQGYGQGIGYGQGVYIDSRAALGGQEMFNPYLQGLPLEY